MKFSWIEPQTGQPDRHRSAPRVDYVSGAVGGLALALVASAIATADPRASMSILGSYRAGLILLGLLLAAICASAAKALAKWRGRGRAPEGGVPPALRSRTAFEVAWMVAAMGLGLVALIASVAGTGGADLLWRAWVVLLIGGAVIGLAASLLTNMVFLVSSRRP